MLRPGVFELPEAPERTVPLATVAHSLQVDAQRKFTAVYEDITQYIDKCDYLFDHDEFYDKSYKSLAKTVGELNKIATDGQQQEREQLYNSLVDWFNTSSFSLEPPTHGIINEHQLIESAQITRDLLVKMLLGLERLRALHMSITQKLRTAAEQALQQTEKADNKRQLLKMVDESTFVWKTAAAEIVQLLHEERSKGGELVEIYADKIRYLMGELEAQAGMIEELRAQLDQRQQQPPVKLHDLDIKTKKAKTEATTRQTKQAATDQLRTTIDVTDDELTAAGAAAAVSTLPDFNKQLMATLQKELDECRRQNASAVARGHEAAAKVRFLTEENNRKDKQIAQLQATIAKLKTETQHVTETAGQQAEADASRRRDSDEQLQGRQTEPTATRQTVKAGRKGRGGGRGLDSVQLQATQDDDDDDTSGGGGRVKLTQLIAAAKRQKPTQPQPQPAGDVAEEPDTGRSTTPVKRAAKTRGLRAKTKTGAPTTATAEATTDGEEEQKAADEVPVGLPQMSNFWQQSAVKEWTPLGIGVDNSEGGVTGEQVGGASGAQEAQAAAAVRDVDMNEAIEMTKLFLGGAASQFDQQQTAAASVRSRRRASLKHQRTADKMAVSTQQLFTDTSGSFKASQQPADTASSRQQRAKTPAEAARMRAARLSDALFHSDHETRSRTQPAR